VRLEILKGGAMVAGCLHGPMHAPLGAIDVKGRVTRVEADRFVVDTCEPATTCTGGEITYVFHGTTPPIGMPVGTFVRVEHRQDEPWNCSEALLVTNLASFGGATNPTRGDAIVWLAIANAIVAPADAPFQVRTAKVSCPFSSGDVYAIEFARTDGSEATEVTMGDDEVWDPPGASPGRLLLHDMGSYRENDQTSDGGDSAFAYWAAHED
jgi:hypothetical protein